MQLYSDHQPLPQAATGESVTSEDLGGAMVHCSISGCTDYFSISEEEGLGTARSIVASLNLPTCAMIDRFIPG